LKEQLRVAQNPQNSQETTWQTKNNHLI
jgi:hypothetical protein